MKYPLPKNSLRELPPDNRDFVLGAAFKQIPLGSIPGDDFMIAEPLLIKDQGESDLCSAYAVAAVSEDQELEELLPEFQFFKTKQISGDPDGLEWGANLRDACKSAVKFGSLPLRGFKEIKGMERPFVLHPESWPSHAESVAQLHKKQTYFSVEGQYDTFDNIRAALWQHRLKKCSIVTGALWRNEWIDAPGGIIPEEYGDAGFGHAFKIFGQKNIKGKLYLVAQLSQGDQVGDRGRFYFSREVVNREIGKYGVFMFTDLTRAEAEALLKKKETAGQKGENLFSKIWSFLAKVFNF